MMEFTVAQIAQLLGGDVEGDDSLKVNQLKKIEEATAGAVTFLSNLRYESFVYTTTASAVIVDRTFEPKKDVSPVLIRVDNAYNAFTQLLEEYHKILIFSKVGVEQPSFIGENSEVGEGIYRGAFSYIGKNCRIGANVKIYPQAFVGDNVSIGDNTILHTGVKVYNNSVIGCYCVLHANAVIGADGFGFAPPARRLLPDYPAVG